MAITLIACTLQMRNPHRRWTRFFSIYDKWQRGLRSPGNQSESEEASQRRINSAFSRSRTRFTVRSLRSISRLISGTVVPCSARVTIRRSRSSSGQSNSSTVSARIAACEGDGSRLTASQSGRDASMSSEFDWRERSRPMSRHAAWAQHIRECQADSLRLCLKFTVTFDTPLECLLKVLGRRFEFTSD